MAKPKKQPEELLETPAGVATADSPIRQDWPEATETRELTIKLSDASRIDVMMDYFKQQDRVTGLEILKKSTAKDFDSRIDEAEKTLHDLAESTKTGTMRGSVHCVWHFETNGRDVNGDSIYHSGTKTLVRSDTGEVVEIKPISQEDRQMTMPLTDEEQQAANIEALKAAGWTLAEAPADSEHDAPFMLKHESGAFRSINGDSMAEAAAAAVGMLSEPAEPTGEESESGEPDASDIEE